MTAPPRGTEPTRMVDGGRPPTATQVADWIGPASFKRWTTLTEFIAEHYPGVFETKWLFGGARFGWTLRYKKSKSFCSLIPERGRFRLLLVFGAREREQVEAILPQLTSHVREDYTGSTTFHDGRWMATTVDSQKVVSDIERLLALKRRPKLPLAV